MRPKNRLFGPVELFWNMGAEGSTTRLQALVEMGFSVVEARLALEATSGNVERAAELLKAHRRERERAQGGPLVARINAFLRNQQPWSEFFDKFLWPEHLHERIETNLLYYRANYAIICGAIVGISALQQPKLLALLGASIALHYGASEWDGRVPGQRGGAGTHITGHTIECSNRAPRSGR